MASVGGGNQETISLNLNPMLDVFSILITFLLMSYSTDPVNHDLKQGIELPDSFTIAALDEVPAISVSQSEIFVQDRKVANIINGDVPESDRSQGAVYPLYVELTKMAKANKVVARLPTGEKAKVGTLAMEMDKNHKFQLMKRIMLSAQQAEFITMKLMVARQGD